jgi:hypothetical protein
MARQRAEYLEGAENQQLQKTARLAQREAPSAWQKTCVTLVALAHRQQQRGEMKL